MNRSFYSKKFEKAMVLVLVFAMIIGLTVQVSYAEEEHWASKELNEWAANGFLKGDGNGNYRPDDDVSRAEFMAFVNRMMGFTEKSADVKNFTDVSESDWYYDEVAKAIEAGYIKGTSSDKMSPKAPITREEAMVILARLSSADEDNIYYKLASDSKEVSSWAVEGVSTCIKEGYIAGNDGMIKPLDKVTRAQTVVMLNRKLTDTRTFGLAGEYDLQGKEVANVIILAEGVTVKNAIVTEDLVVAKSVGEGEVYLEGVEVKGDLFAYGGGENSLYFKNTTVNGRLVVEKENGKIRVVATGNTRVSVTVLESGVILVNQTDDGVAFNQVEIQPDLGSEAQVELVGNFDAVGSEAEGLNLRIEGEVEQLSLEEDATITGTGSVNQIETGENVELTFQDEEGNEVVLDEDATSVAFTDGQIDGTSQDNGNTGNNGNNGNGNGNSNPPGEIWTVTFEVVGVGNEADEPTYASVEVTDGDLLTAPEIIEVERNEFLAFMDGDGENAQEFDFNSPITGNITIYSTYRPLIPVVFLERVGEDEYQVLIAPIFVSSGKTISDPEFERNGKIAIWCTDMDLQNEYDFSTPITAPTQLFAKWPIDSELVSAHDALSFEDIKGANTSDWAVSRNLNLVESIEGFSDVSISWESDDNQTISNTGIVTQKGMNTDVTLTATLSKDGATLTKDINVTVFKDGYNIDVEGSIDDRFAPGYPKIYMSGDTIVYKVKLKEAPEPDKPVELFVTYDSLYRYEENKNYVTPESVFLATTRGDAPYPSFYSRYATISTLDEVSIRLDSASFETSVSELVLKEGDDLGNDVAIIKIDTDYSDDTGNYLPGLSALGESYGQAIFINDDLTEIRAYFGYEDWYGRQELLDTTSVPPVSAFSLSNSDGTIDSVTINSVEISNIGGDTPYSMLKLNVNGLEESLLSGLKLKYTVPDENYLQDIANPSNKVASFNQNVKKIEATLEASVVGPRLISLSISGIGFLSGHFDYVNDVEITLDDQAIDIEGCYYIWNNKSSTIYLRLGEAVNATQGTTLSATIDRVSPYYDLSHNPYDDFTFSGNVADIDLNNKPYQGKLSFEDEAKYQPSYHWIDLPASSGLFTPYSHPGAFLSIEVGDENNIEASYRLRAKNTMTPGLGMTIMDTFENYSYLKQVIFPKVAEALDAGKKVRLVYDTTYYSEDKVIYQNGEHIDFGDMKFISSGIRDGGLRPYLPYGERKTWNIVRP